MPSKPEEINNDIYVGELFIASKNQGKPFDTYLLTQ